MHRAGTEASRWAAQRASQRSIPKGQESSRMLLGERAQTTESLPNLRMALKILHAILRRKTKMKGAFTLNLKSTFWDKKDEVRVVC